MPDPMNALDALLNDLAMRGLFGWHADLIALKREREALANCVKDQHAQIKALAASNAILHGRLEDADAAVAAEKATTASLLRSLALICEAGGWQKKMLSELPDAVKAMRKERDEAQQSLHDYECGREAARE